MGGVVQPRDDPSTQGISHSNSRNSTADHSRPSSSYENVSESLPSNFNVLLLQTPADAYFFDPNHLEHDPEKIKLSAGTLLYEDAKARGKEQIARRMSALRNNKSSNKDNCLAYDILNDSIFANVSQSNVMRITDNQALILMPVPSAERLNLHKDFSRMHFLETLKQGDIVQVLSKSDPCGSSDSMRSGRVEWIGEQQNRLGRLYGISSHNDFDSHFPTMSTDFHRSHAPKQIHYYPPHHVYPPQIPTHEHSIPTKSPISNFDRAAPSRTRVIPIERKDSPKSLSNSNSSFSPASSSHASLQPYYDREPFESAQYPRHGTRPNNSFDLLTNDGIPNPRTGGEQFENDIRNWNGGSSLRRKPSAEPEYSSFGRRDHSDNRSKEDIVRERRISGPGDQRRSREDEKSTNRETMLRSQSKSRLTASQSRDISHATISVDDPMLAQRVSVGDRCIWSGHPCTVRFIGYLKGHASIYAGVEFDDKVGKGTGAFEGETVFRTPDGHAGFVILSALEVIGDKPVNAIERETQKQKLNDVPNSHDSRPPPPYHQVAPSKPEDFLINGLDIGSRVSANYVGAIQSGTVKWIGDSMSDERDRIMKCAVVQLDSEPPSGWRLASDDPDLSINFSEPRCVILPYNPQTLKACPTGSGSNGSSGDVEMADVSGGPFSSHHQEPERVDFGNLDSDVQLTKVYPTRNKEDLIGRMKGIQGHRNSCYLDSMLFAMFSQTTVYDHLLDRIPRSDDVPQLKELQRILATEIVYPLRKSHYVRADHVMKVRELLQSILPNMKGLTTEEKDPEEIINEVFGKIFKAPHAVRFIKDNKIDSMHICPIIVEEWSQGIVTTQHLLERHMVASNVRFAEPPKTLIIQLPRYGQQKLFDKTLPLESINITPLVDRATVKCGFCDSPAVVHCPECYLCNRVFLSEVSYCKSCFYKHIEHKEFADHLPHPYKSSSKKPQNYRMSLTAVLCIETSHYVSFVRTLSGEWVFFDSMADREGYSNGYNVPIVKQCEGISYWLSNDAWKRLRNADEQQVKQIFGRGSTEADPLVCRMLSDSYFCFYEEEPHSPKSMASSSSSNSLLSVFKKNSS